MTKRDPRLEEALRLLDPPAGHRLWYGGATVLGSLRGVSHRAAAWRPAPDRRCVWELALHIAYWKYAVRRRLEDGPRGAFPREPSNFPRLPDPATAAAWKADRALLAAEHAAVTAAVRAFDPGRLTERVSPRSSYRYLDLIFGVVTHDIHHTGQIQLLKRLYRGRR